MGHRSESSDRSLSPEWRRRHRDRSPNRSRRRHHSRSPRRHLDEEEERSSRSKRKRDRSPSVSSSSSSSESDSSYERRHRRHKKSKKKRKLKKKSSKKKKKKSSKSKLGSVGNDWGKYGIIHESDIFTKDAEFQAWLIEVKKIDVEMLNNSKRKELFIDFMDDYNTATMPHEKYYNLARWEAREHAIRMGEVPPDDTGIVNLKRDEEQLRLQHRQAARTTSSKQPPLQMSQEQIEELARVNRERVQADRLRRLGLTPREGMGVRYEYTDSPEF